MEEKFSLLLNFSGAGSKLLQAQLSTIDQVCSIPAYPLKYLPFFYEEWKKKDRNLTPQKLFNLIFKHHKSIFDSRYIKGFNGLNNLGKDKKGYVKISKDKFKVYFIKFFKNKKINQKNLIFAVHESYKNAINNNGNNFIYHVHDLEIFDKYLKKDFNNNNIIFIIRNPILAFWRRAYSDNVIDKDRFDFTDYEELLNFRYINRLRDILINIENFKSTFNKNSIVIRFEDLKSKNYEIMKKLCSKLSLKFNFDKISKPKFANQIWWGSNVYKGHAENYSYKKKLSFKDDLIKFFPHEIFLLEIALLPLMKKFNYKDNLRSKINFFSYIKFFIFLFLPTKYGLNLLKHRLSLITLKNYVKNASFESFNRNKLKNYYFNGMYRFKWSYKFNYLLKFNVFRKLKYKHQNNLFLNLIYFLIKIFIYPLIILEFSIIYFVRIFIIINIFFKSSRVRGLKKI